MSLYVAFEGIDGSGKSKQLSLLVSYLIKTNKTVFETSELGSTHDPLCVKMRDLFLNNNHNIDELALQHILAASSIQHSEKVLKNQQDKVDYIISDRSIESNLAYGYASTLNRDIVDLIFCTDARRIVPDLIIYLDVDPILASKRRSNRQKEAFENNGSDRIEDKSTDFQQLVREEYLKRARLNNKYIIIDTNNVSIDDTHRLIVDVFNTWKFNHQTR